MFAVNFYDATLHSSEKGKSKAMHSNTCELQAYSSKKKKKETGMNEKGYVWYQPTYTQLLKTCKTEVGIV